MQGVRAGRAGGLTREVGRRLSAQGPEPITWISGCSSNYNRKPPKFCKEWEFQKIVLLCGEEGRQEWKGNIS